MLGIKTPPRKPDVDEAEKPFWISYSDLMTALMVLFLVAMSVSLFSITQEVISGPEAHRNKVDGKPPAQPPRHPRPTLIKALSV